MEHRYRGGRGAAARLPAPASRPSTIQPPSHLYDPDVIYNLGLIIGASALLVLLTRGQRIPTIILYILAGLALGPLTGLVTITGTVHLIAEVGIALLLFLVGLELNLAKIRDVGRVAVVAGIGQVVFTAAGGFGLAMLLGFTVMESLFTAVALTFSSTVVVVKLLDEKKELHARYGRIAVGIFLVQDLVVVIALTFLAGLMNPDALDFASIAGGLGLAFVGMAVLLTVALLASRYVLRPVFGWVARSPEGLFIWSLLWCFLFVVAAEGMALSVEIGAFLAGISLAQLPYADDLRRRVHPMVNFFIAIFFVSLGIQMELGAALVHWKAAVVLSLFVLIGNPFIFMWIIAKMGYTERTSFLTSVTVAQISEFSFIFAAMGLSAGLIDEGILSLIALVGLVTIGLSAYMILYNHELYRAVSKTPLLRIFGARREGGDDEPAASRAGHVIVVGMNPLGRYLAVRLVEQGESVLAIDTDPVKLEGLPCETLHGNAIYASVLEEAHLSDARLLVSALQIEDTNNLLAFRSHRAGVPCAIHAFDQSVVADLRDLGVDYLIRSKVEGTRKIIDELRQRGVIAS
jgi:Kef-type K+ transport system membrane component KefB